MFRAEPTPRLVRSPAFLLSSPRSGSTLLRSILGTHSQIHTSPELALTEVGVRFLRFPARHDIGTIHTELAFGESGLTTDELEYLLWDRILHRELLRGGKPVLFHKTPRLLLRWRRLAECWPEAKFIFLLRHPMNVLLSGRDLTSGLELMSWAALSDFYLRYFYLLREARTELPGLTVRYEDLTADPEKVCRAICDYLEVEWEPSMLEYGDRGLGRFVPGFGDMSTKLKSGRLQPGRPLPAEKDIPNNFRPICVEFGYLPRPDGAGKTVPHERRTS